MNVLAELQKRARTVATPATPATQGQFPVVESQESQESQGVGAEIALRPTPSVYSAVRVDRVALLTLAEGLGLDHTIVHRLTTADLTDCAGFNAEALRTYLLMLDATATRWAGKVPEGETAAILCVHCGPVFAHPNIAAVLPIVDGWPRALGCPWCFIRKAGLQIPRPDVTCAICKHFRRNPLNSAEGMGQCTVGATRPHDPPTYPNCLRRCGSWRPWRIDHE